MPEAEGNALEYAAASVLLRAPRAAVVVPDHDRWPTLVGHVLHQAARIWGGAGFTLVAHQAGAVAPHWLRIMAGYDPDHVVAATVGLPEYMGLYPDFKVLLDGEPVSPEKALELGMREDMPLSPADDLARLTVSDACSPFRRARPWGGDDPRLRYEKTRLPENGERDLVVVAEQLDIDPTLDFESKATRLAAVWLASLTAPVRQVGDASAEAGSTVLDTEGHASRVRAAAATATPFAWGSAPGWQPSMVGLTLLLAWPVRDQYWIVVGDTLEDFALAHTLSRATHGALWLPESWLDPKSPYASAAHHLLAEVRLAGFHTTVRVVSTSADAAVACERLESVYGIFIEPKEPWLTPCSLDDLSPASTGALLALQNDYDRDLLLPVVRERNGNRRLVDKLPPLIPETPIATGTRAPDWVIDVTPLNDSVPRGRGLPPDCLQGGTDPWRERIRAGRDGLSIMSSSYGFVTSNATLRQRTARPTLTFPSPQTWLTEMGVEAGVEVATSDAGHLAQVASNLWGSRRTFAADIANFGSLFREFLTDVDRTDVRYPELDGVVLRQEGFLAWPALVRVLGSNHSSEEIRAFLDRLVEQRSIRRGFIVGCPDCGRAQFTVPENPDFSTRCDRCQAPIPLLARTWRSPIEEPHWYYDLHPSVRRILREHGDVALLAEHHLSASIQRGAGLPEFELRRDGKVTAEIDMLFLAPNSVHVGEAKKSPTIPRGELPKKVKGLVRAAQALRADSVVLAAGDPGRWDPVVVARLIEEIRSASWSTGAAPAIRLLSGLRTGTIEDVDANDAKHPAA